MKCPLRSVGTHEHDEICGIDTFDCLKEECAWYHQGLKDCSHFLMQDYLALIMAQLVELNRAKGGR